MIAYTLDRLGTTPEESKVIMVGDRKHDIIGAHENQLPCAAVLYGYRSGIIDEMGQTTRLRRWKSWEIS